MTIIDRPQAWEQKVATTRRLNVLTGILALVVLVSLVLLVVTGVSALRDGWGELAKALQ